MPKRTPLSKSSTPLPDKKATRKVTEKVSGFGALLDAGCSLGSTESQGSGFLGVSSVPGRETPSEEQRAIIDAARKLPKVMVIRAGAGTGKTTALRMLAETLRGNGQYTAFNSALVGESKEKFQGTRCACNTTHSLGFRAVGNKYGHRLGGGRVLSSQIAAILGLREFKIPMGGEGSESKFKILSASFLAGSVMGAIKRFCQSDSHVVLDKHFRYIDGIDIPDADGRKGYENNQRVRDYLMPYAKHAWSDLSSVDGQLPFNHDHYVKIWQLTNPIIAGDYILLDEAQDTAPVMLDILRQQKVPLILVGDNAQQIYEWRGAMNALGAFGDDVVQLTLSQSYRFGEEVAKVANAVLETLDEPVSLRLKGLPSINSVVAAIEKPDCILTRTNALAVTSLLEAISQGRKPFLVGGGDEVLSFVKAAQELQNGIPTSYPQLACFSTWGEVQEYSKQEDGEDLRLMVKLIDGFTCKTIIGALGQMSTEQNADIVICTAHKSKGRAWGKVQIASDFPTKSKSTDPDRRLLYVAVTRARYELDVTRCPFFTGEDALDLSSVISSVPKLPEFKEETGKPLSNAPSCQAPSEYTWMKNDGEWAVRGPETPVGSVVEVVRKDGSRQKKTIVRKIKNFGPVFIYEV